MRRSIALLSVAVILSACGEAASSSESPSPPTITTPQDVPSAPAGGVGNFPSLALSTATGDVIALHDGEFVTGLNGLLTPITDEVVGSRRGATGQTVVEWRDVQSGEPAASQTVAGDLSITAVSSSGTLAALTDAKPGGVKATSEVVVVDRNKGELGRWTLPGNLVPEAFANAYVPEGKGMPIGVFAIEYLPSGAYRVRVIDTATGQLGLPLNLRNKSQQVDEEIRAISRTAVFDPDRQLLFTLYQGTTEDMPSDDSFIHTLGLINGVWCLAVPAELELGGHDGALAVSPTGRLIAASPNGMVAGYDIDDITDPGAQPVANTIVELRSGARVAITADADEVAIAIDDTVFRLDPTTLEVRDTFTWDMAIEALALVDEDVIIVGAGRMTRVGPSHALVAERILPDGLEAIRRITLLSPPG